jgi:hydroxymethylbilane synthase
MARSIRIGTRGSDLALAQARLVAALVRERHGIDCELEVVATSGDRDRTTALHELSATGFFTRELQLALRHGVVDLVVHSLKDLPTEEPEGLAIAAVPAREDPADVLLVRPGRLGDGGLGLRHGARVGTSSLRRAGQTLALQPGVTVTPLRGNVPTRLRRLRDGEYDAIVLAAAGLARLGCDLRGLSVRRLDPDVFLPAPGQGALAVETRESDRATREIAAGLDDPEAAATSACERSLLHALEGGCSLPLGALARVVAGGLELHASLAAIDPAGTHATLRRCVVRGAHPADTAARALAALTGEGA